MKRLLRFLVDLVNWNMVHVGYWTIDDWHEYLRGRKEKNNE